MARNFIPEHIIDQIRDSADIVEVISQYVQLRKTGRNFVGLCPFHSEKTPSFSVNPEKAIFYCFGCGKGGNVFKFLMEFEHLTFVESARHLADRYHINIPDTEPEKSKVSGISEENLEPYFKIHEEAQKYFTESLQAKIGEPCREYLRNRGLPDEVARSFQLGYAPSGWEGFCSRLKEKKIGLSIAEKSGLVLRSKDGEGYYDRFRGRLMFPIHNITGRIVAFGGRSIDGQDPKYLNSPENPIYTKGNILYGLSRAKQTIRRLRYAMIVEGYMDLIALASVGIDQVVATLGTALTLSQARLLKRFASRVALVFDSDSAGVNATLRGVEIFAEIGVETKVVHLPGEKDPDDFIREHGIEKFKDVFKEAPNGIEYVFDHHIRRPEFLSPHGKAQIVSDVIPVLAKIKNAVIRREYIRKFAEISRTDEILLLEEMNKLKHRRITPTRKSDQSQSPGPDRIETHLIQCLILKPALINTLIKTIDLEEIVHPSVKQSLDTLLDQQDTLTSINSAKIIDHFRSYLNESVMEGLTTLMDPVAGSRGEEGQGDDGDTKITQIFNDCLIKIRKRFLETQLKKLNIAIKEAEKADNDPLVNSLSHKKSMLKKNLIKGNYFF